MIVTEKITINGREFVRTYSDENFYVERDGERYSEAIDPIEYGRQYVETDEPIENEEDLVEATEEDYQNALGEFGVKV